MLQQKPLGNKYLSWMIYAAGITKMTIPKFTGTMIAAKMPKALIGLISEPAFERNAIAVVLDVTKIAPKERLQA